MLKVNAGYSKKVPVPGQEYSSQSYHATLEAELSDGLTPVQIETRVHEVFELVRSSVEKELNGEKPVVQMLSPRKETRSQTPGKKSSSTEKASNKQIKYITDLALQRGLGIQALSGEIQSRFQVDGLYELNRSQASELLNMLKAA